MIIILCREATLNNIHRAESLAYYEDGGSRLLRNVGKALPGYTASYPRRQTFSGNIWP
jgi:hypothetical protein